MYISALTDYKHFKIIYRYIILLTVNDLFLI